MKQETEYQPSTFKAIFRRVLMVLGVLSGFGIGVSYGVYYMQKEAIKHDAGGYHAKTGEWDWFSSVEEISREKQEVINMACKALGSKAKNDPQCLLMGR